MIRLLAVITWVCISSGKLLENQWKIKKQNYDLAYSWPFCKNWTSGFSMAYGGFSVQFSVFGICECILLVLIKFWVMWLAAMRVIESSYSTLGNSWPLSDIDQPTV